MPRGSGLFSVICLVSGLDMRFWAESGQRKIRVETTVAESVASLFGGPRGFGDRWECWSFMSSSGVVGESGSRLLARIPHPIAMRPRKGWATRRIPTLIARGWARVGWRVRQRQKRNAGVLPLRLALLAQGQDGRCFGYLSRKGRENGKEEVLGAGKSLRRGIHNEIVNRFGRDDGASCRSALLNLPTWWGEFICR
jgi:hypothetical protein